MTGWPWVLVCCPSVPFNTRVSVRKLLEERIFTLRFADGLPGLERHRQVQLCADRQDRKDRRNWADEPKVRPIARSTASSCYCRFADPVTTSVTPELMPVCKNEICELEFASTIAYV